MLLLLVTSDTLITYTGYQQYKSGVCVSTNKNVFYTKKSYGYTSLCTNVVVRNLNQNAETFRQSFGRVSAKLIVETSAETLYIC